MDTVQVKNEQIDTSNDDELEDEDEWEEMTMLVTVNGILDADLVREAVKTDTVKLRYAETENPVLQLSNSLYTATWTRDLGTNIIIESRSPDDFEVISCSSNILQAEKALLTSVKSDETSSLAAPVDEIPNSSITRSTFPKTKL
ncbi:unnamed protein product [Caenorhabditis angaria]|uniref:Transcription factor TFIIIC triple barrel domain-containing protein n=1 Tax=Caenorhabditis angaria TaxID=860376 RepID=A0A9P1I6N9_9PELO|nr:unnamed protein product [Caenorhabditis angaria]